MSTVFLILAGYLLLTLVPVLVRLFRGPGSADRMLAVTLIGTTAAAVLMLLSFAGGSRGLLDAALAVAFLSAVPVLVFSLHLARRRPNR